MIMFSASPTIIYIWVAIPFPGLFTVSGRSINNYLQPNNVSTTAPNNFPTTCLLELSVAISVTARSNRYSRFGMVI